MGTKTLEAGAALIQRLKPIEQFSLYLDGFHFESGHFGRQMRACHYCTMLNEDVTQCIIFDSAGPDARLVGVEYIISEELFALLPTEEKPFWHSHQYEIKSGQLAAPSLPEWAESRLMKKLKSTYGKIWRTWDTSQSPAVPLGGPKLMMSFTEEGQLQPKLLAERDRLLGISTAENRRRRAGLATPPVQKGADAWEHGEVLQIQAVATGLNFDQSE